MGVAEKSKVGVRVRGRVRERARAGVKRGKESWKMGRVNKREMLTYSTSRD